MYELWFIRPWVWVEHHLLKGALLFLILGLSFLLIGRDVEEGLWDLDPLLNRHLRIVIPQRFLIFVPWYFKNISIIKPRPFQAPNGRTSNWAISGLKDNKFRVGQALSLSEGSWLTSTRWSFFVSLRASLLIITSKRVPNLLIRNYLMVISRPFGCVLEALLSVEGSLDRIRPLLTSCNLKILDISWFDLRFAKETARFFLILDFLHFPDVQFAFFSKEIKIGDENAYNLSFHAGA